MCEVTEKERERMHVISSLHCNCSCCLIAVINFNYFECCCQFVYVTADMNSTCFQVVFLGGRTRKWLPPTFMYKTGVTNKNWSTASTLWYCKCDSTSRSRSETNGMDHLIFHWLFLSSVWIFLFCCGPTIPAYATISPTVFFSPNNYYWLHCNYMRFWKISGTDIKDPL